MFEMRRGLLAGAGLPQILRQLDATVAAWGDEKRPTAIFMVADPARGTVQVVSAGHLPLLRRGHRSNERWAGGGPPLGSGTVRQQTEYSAGPEDIIFAFTNGLVQRRGRSLEDTLLLIEKTARMMTTRGEIASELVRRTAELLGQPTDDATLVSVRLGVGRAAVGWAAVGRAAVDGPERRAVDLDGRADGPGTLGLTGPAPGEEHGPGRGNDRRPLAAAQRVVLKVYVDPHDPRSARTESIVREFAATAGGGAAVQVQVLDINESSEEAEADGVIAAPSVLRLAPGPTVQIVGALRSTRELVAALELPHPEVFQNE